jgi:putative transposase
VKGGSRQHGQDESDSTLTRVARALRLEIPGAVYHVTSRGNAGADIFLDDDDRRLFLGVLTRAVGRFAWLCHAFCLMDNHYHLLLETPRPNLSRGMRSLNSVYAQAFNRRRRCRGHVFQGRFHAVLVEKERHLLELARYVVLNPVRARLVQTAVDWPWSSYRAAVGTAPCPSYLTLDWLLAQFGGERFRARERYRRFVAEGLGDEPWEDLRGGIYLGCEKFVRESSERAEPITGVPRDQWQPVRRPLGELFGADGDCAVAVAYRTEGYRLCEIADHLGVHPTTVSRRLRRLEEQTGC